MQQSKLKKVFKACRQSFIYVGIFSCFVNLLMLTIPIYMLQIFDRVVPSQSYDTLLFLTIIAVFALLVLAFLDGTRSRVLLKVSHWLDNNLSPLAFAKSTAISLKDNRYTRQSLMDVSKIREFLCGNDIVSLFDSPWTIIYLLVIYMLKPFLGVVATIGVIVLLILSVINELVTRDEVAQANQQNMKTQAIIDSTLNNAESIQAMGMLDSIVKKWFSQNEKTIGHQQTASSRSTALLSAAKFLRMSLQISILGVGAYFVVKNEFTPGAMIAASILTSRAMAPVERMIGTWKRFLNVRQSYDRLNDFIQEENPYEKNPFLTDPQGKLVIENLYYKPPSADQPIIKGVNLTIHPKESIAIIGPSGAGKSTLARLMLGLWAPSAGHIALDGCEVSTVQRDVFGNHVGYCPQEVKLFAGSVRENIARLGEIDDEAVVTAARFVGAHDMILSLPQGYNTLITQYGLSGGQQQLIVLAQCFYKNPCFIVLDEPSANLDEQGKISLAKTLQLAKNSGITLVLITHQPQYLQLVDNIMVLNQGTIQAYGPKEKIIQGLQQKINQNNPNQGGQPSQSPN